MKQYDVNPADASTGIAVGLLALAIAVACGVVGCASSGKPDVARTPPSPVPSNTPTAKGAVTPSSEKPDLSRLPKALYKLGPPERPRDWEHARLQAAERLIAANPDLTYTGKPPPILLAIPVLTVELNADGSVRNIAVMRYPSQARDTVKTAMEAIRKAAPFGDISRLPKPWKFNETFLFNAERKFKPMTLDRL